MDPPVSPISADLARAQPPRMGPIPMNDYPIARKPGSGPDSYPGYLGPEEARGRDPEQRDSWPESRVHNQYSDEDQAESTFEAGPVSEKIISGLFLEHSPNWTPIWLKRTTLWAFACVYLACAAGLLTLQQLSSSENGFYVSASTTHYAWTYGPTAFLALVAGSWGQVDVYVKMAGPWRDLRRTGADGTTLVNALTDEYISLMPHDVFIRAFRRRHWPVLISATCQLLLRASIVLSTGILVLQDENVRQSVSIPVNVFNSDRFNTLSSQILKDANAISFFRSQLDFPSAHVYSLYANWTQNVSLPYGTTEELTYATFSSPEITGPESTISLTVDTFVPSLECVALEATVLPKITVDSAVDLYANIAVSGGFCESWPDISWPLTGIGLEKSANSPKTVITVAWRADYKCGGGQSPLATSDQWPTTPDVDGFFMVTAAYTFPTNITLSKYTYTKISISGDATSNATIVLSPVNVIACKPSYEMGSVNITAQFSPNNTREPVSTTLSQPFDMVADGLDGMDSSSLVAAFEASFWNVMNFFGQSLSPEIGQSLTKPGTNDTFIVLTTLAMGDQDERITTLFDNERAISAIRRTFSAVMAGFANQVLSSSATRNVPATMDTTASRLTTSDIVVQVMIAIFTTLAVLTAVLSFCVKAQFLTASWGSLGSAAHTLALSPYLAGAFDNTGLLSNTDLKSHLAARIGAESAKFGTRPGSDDDVGHSFISSSEHEEDPILDTTAVTWWRPLILRRWVLSLIGIVAIAIIVILEVFQRLSDANSGVGFAANNNTVARLVTRFVPALVMVILAVLVGAADTAVVTFAPFTALKRGGAAPSILSKSLIGMTMPARLLFSSKVGYWGVLFSGFGAFVATFLTIAVSGLYIISDVPYPVTATASPTDYINPGFPQDGYNNGGVLLSLIERQGMEYPPGSFDELVIPHVAMNAELNSTFGLADGSISVNLTAMRATLDCYVVPTQLITTDDGQCEPSNPKGGSVSILAQNEVGCLWENGSIDWNATSTPDGDLLVGQGSAGPGEWSGMTKFDGARIPCASFSLYFSGYFDCPARNGTAVSGTLTDSTPAAGPSMSNITALRCTQQVQQVSALVTYTDSSLSIIDVTAPPVVDESTVSLLTNQNSTFGHWFPFDLKTPLEHEFELWNVNQSADALGQMIVYGTDALPLQQLLGQDNAANLVSATTRAYRRAMAQMLNSGARVPCSNPNSTSFSSVCGQGFPVLGTAPRKRVLQDRDSKIVLQALLGTIVVCGAAAALLVRARDVLPHNPYSVAGIVSLVAGGRLCVGFEELVAEGEAPVSERGLRAALERFGPSYSLGFWPGVVGGSGPHYGVDIDGS